MAPGGEQTRKGKPRREEEAAPEEQTTTDAKSEDVDELLDEIDEVLEANAEDFVRGFVQKGGEARALRLKPPPLLWGFASG